MASRAGMAVAALLAAGAASAQQQPVTFVGKTPHHFSKGTLEVLSYSVVPDGTISALQINRSAGVDDDFGVTIGQIGAGFTWSDSFPLYLEGYLGYARYDPRFVFKDSEELQRLPTKWSQVSSTVGVGYDVPIARNLVLRPIANASLGRVTTDATLAENLAPFRRSQDVTYLEHGELNAWGLGGSLMLVYKDHLPEREIDVELRGTDLYLRTFGDTSAAVRGDTNAVAMSLWGRLRWPTGYEAFDRPVRWVVDGTHSRFFGEPEGALGFNYLSKIGGGLELDLGALKIGAFGAEVQRVRLVGRYVFAPNVSGFSIGLGISF